MTNVLDTLKERGYIKQFTHEDETRELLEKEKVTFYIGFDPTADSLHVGHFIAMMFMSHMQKAGHRPIALIGGGTAMIGDPSGKTDMRTMMTEETIQHNVDSIKKQMEKFIDFSDDKALLVNNADWLLKQNYVDFIRNIGVHFSVNRMLGAECFKQRMETGLSFLEFNYMLMQGFDFYELNRVYDCKLELGGDDQWSNMIAGVDLVRKKSQKSAYAMTCTLLTNSEGQKMGKTVGGALWLDAAKTSPYDFYQYWRNVADVDVEKCLKLLTFVEMDEVRRLCALEGSAINEAKKVLGFEVTKLIHGEEEARKAMEAAESVFGAGQNMDNVPTIEISKEEIGAELLGVLAENGVFKSKGEGRRLIQQGGVSVNDEKLVDDKKVIEESDFKDDMILVKRGKKKFYKIVIK
ncbi:tyrosine--tRNA ligase [uncultured Clostridium sp.]|uniref:tyrosine--tRNA ligase n=1 Tax=uncultured Clostridium sp. TaxID=59620 RepID=UPI00262AE570|nr:tyrosine--tRNA ligase [uncultured Clostridium sp.]